MLIFLLLGPVTQLRSRLLMLVTVLQVMRSNHQLRERSKSCAVEETDVEDQSFERSVSLPDVIERKTPDILSQGGKLTPAHLSAAHANEKGSIIS